MEVAGQCLDARRQARKELRARRRWQVCQLSLQAPDAEGDVVKLILQGNKKVKKDKIDKALGFVPGQFFSARDEQRAKTQILDLYAKEGSIAFAKRLIEHAKIAVAPGIGFGDYGDDHVRIALIENEHRLRQALRGIREMFRKDGLLKGAA